MSIATPIWPKNQFRSNGTVTLRTVIKIVGLPREEVCFSKMKDSLEIFGTILHFLSIFTHSQSLDILSKTLAEGGRTWVRANIISRTLSSFKHLYACKSSSKCRQSLSFPSCISHTNLQNLTRIHINMAFTDSFMGNSCKSKK